MSSCDGGGDGDTTAVSPAKQATSKRAAPNPDETERDVRPKLAKNNSAGGAPTVGELVEQGLLPQGLTEKYNVMMGLPPDVVKTMLQDAWLPLDGDKHRRVLRLVRKVADLPPTDEDKELVEEHELKMTEKAAGGKKTRKTSEGTGSPKPKAPKQRKPQPQDEHPQSQEEQPEEQQSQQQPKARGRGGSRGRGRGAQQTQPGQSQEEQELKQKQPPPPPRPVPPKEVVQSFIRELIQTSDLRTMTLRRVFTELQEKYELPELVEGLQKRIRQMVVREIERKRETEEKEMNM